MNTDIKKELAKIKSQGAYTKTDMTGYSELTSGKIKAALITKKPELLYPIFSLIEDKDTAVGSELRKRRSTVRGKYITHDLPKSQASSIYNITNAAIDAIMYGHGLVELYLDSSMEFRFAHIDKEMFYFSEKGLELKSGKTLFAPKEPRFILFRQKPLLTNLIWLTFAKHFVLSHYMKFTEFLGVPPIVVNASSSEEEVIEEIYSALKGLNSGSFAILGKEDVVKVLEGRGSQADFLEFVRYCDAEIAKCINGSVLSSNTSANGSLAQAKVHEANRYEIIADDARFVESCINQCFAMLGTEANAQILIEKDIDLLARAQMLAILNPMGYVMSPEQIAKEFDLPMPVNNATPANNLSSNFAQSPKLGTQRAAHAASGFLAHNIAQTSTPKFLDRFDAGVNSADFKAALNGVERDINKTLNSLLASSNSYEEAFEELLSKYPDTHFDTLEELMFNAIANSQILGNIDK